MITPVWNADAGMTVSSAAGYPATADLLPGGHKKKAPFGAGEIWYPGA